MLTLIFAVTMFMVFGKLIGVAFRMTWGIAKAVLTLVFLPLILIWLFVGGLVYVALIALIIIGIVSLVARIAGA